MKHRSTQNKTATSEWASTKVLTHPDSNMNSMLNEPSIMLSAVGLGGGAQQANKASQSEAAAATTSHLLYAPTQFTRTLLTDNSTFFNPTLFNTTAPLAIPVFRKIQGVDYRLLQKVYEGTNSAVYRGEMLRKDLKPMCSDSNGTIAVKIVETFVKNGAGESSMVSFEQEVAIMWLLGSHLYFCPLVAYTTSPKAAIITKWYPTGSLSDWLHGDDAHNAAQRQTPWSQLLIRDLALDMAQGISEMHRLGLVHCDLKAANILLEQGDRLTCKITDFGLSSVISNMLLQVKGFQVVRWKGASMPYASPELLVSLTTSEIIIAPTLDVYAMGITLWEMAYQQKPWTGQTTQEIERNVRTGQRPPLQNSPFDAILRQCWAQDPQWRMTAEQVALKLGALL